MSKRNLRQAALESRRAIPRARVAVLSRMVGERLATLQEFRRAQRVASYVGRDDEVQTTQILESLLSQGKKIFVPLVDQQTDTILFFEIHSLGELSPGKFGIPEPRRTGPPVPLNDTDVVLVPLLAWDSQGNRVGYGRGYFDRALARRGGATAIGLAFESQSVPSIPAGRADVRLDVVVTEKRALRFGPEHG